jgi:hypothetical protein
LHSKHDEFGDAIHCKHLCCAHDLVDREAIEERQQQDQNAILGFVSGSNLFKGLAIQLP